ncbi:hypothetical protein ASD59_13260, partial [Brevundimonas sp. Root608]
MSFGLGSVPYTWGFGQTTSMRDMMKVKLLAGVAMAGLLAAGAAAAEPNGWYGAIDAGYHTLGDVETISQTTS